MNAWEILGIEPTDNKRQIKKAYASKLAQFHPEEYPEEFKKIQDAYKSIMQSLNRQYNDDRPQVNLQEDFKRKTNIYDIGDLRKVLEETSKKEPKRLYEELNLEDSFKNIDARKKKKKELLDKEIHQIEIPEQEEVLKGKHDEKNDPIKEVHQIEIPEQEEVLKGKREEKNDPIKEVHQIEIPEKEEILRGEAENLIEKTTSPDSLEKNTFNNDNNEELNLNRFYFEKFKERLQFSKSINNVRELILNEAFYTQMGNRNFYNKISKLLENNIATFDSIVLSFLYDAFLTIAQNYGYPVDGYHLPTKIKKHHNQERKIARIKDLSSTVIIVVVIIIAFVVAILGERNKKLEKQKMDEMREIFEYERTEEGEAQRVLDETILLMEVQKQYPAAVRCKINNFDYNAGSRPSIIFAVCYTDVEGEEIKVTAFSDKDGNFTNVTILQPTLE